MKKVVGTQRMSAVCDKSSWTFIRVQKTVVMNGGKMNNYNLRITDSFGKPLDKTFLHNQK